MKKRKTEWKVGDAVGVTSHDPKTQRKVFRIACFSVEDVHTAWVDEIEGGPRRIVRVCDLYKPFGSMLSA